MKYGILVADQAKQRGRKSNFINIGDDFQGYAILCLLKEMGVGENDIVMIASNELKNYNGEYIILPINFYVEAHSAYEIFPLSPHIIPVFLGLHYRLNSTIDHKVRDYFVQYQPIGCRDEYTMNILRENGIQAYLFGCITATIPNLAVNTLEISTKFNSKKILCVDVPKSIYDYIPKSLTDKYEVESISHIIYDTDLAENYLDDLTNFDFTHKIREKILHEYIEKYINEAALVITSRVHCLVPCLAMGVPIIAAFENRPERLAWIDKLITLYATKEFSTINWDLTPIDLEDIKLKMKEVAKRRINETKKNFEYLTELSFYWENRKKSKYANVFEDILARELNVKDDHFEYIIWGTGAIGANLYKTVVELYPRSKLVSVIDTYSDGDFFGQAINKPDARYQYPDALILVASYSGQNEIEQQLISDGKQRGKNYILCGITTG